MAIKKSSSASSSSSAASSLPADEALVHRLLQESLSNPNVVTTAVHNLQKNDHTTDSEDNNKLCLEALQGLLTSSSSNQIVEQYNKVYERIHSPAILSNKIQVKQLTESISKESIEKCFKYLESQKLRLNSETVNVMALRFHELLIHLTFLGKSIDIIGGGVVESWIQPLLQLYINDSSPTTTTKELLTYTTQSVRFFSKIVSSFREMVNYVARSTYIFNISMARKNRLEKESKSNSSSSGSAQKTSRKEDPNKVIDPEEAMLQEMDKADEEKLKEPMMDNEREVDEYFDEDENERLLEFKKRVINKNILGVLIQAGEKNIKNLSSLEKANSDGNGSGENDEIAICYHYISKLIIQTLVELLDVSVSQPRFEEISSMVADLSKNFLSDFIDYYFDKDRLMLEKALLLISCFISNEKLIPLVYTSGLIGRVVDLLKKYVVKGEEGSKFSAYICSLCCYIIGRSCIKNNSIASSILKDYGSSTNNYSLMATIFNSLMKNNRAVTLKHMTYAAFLAFQGLVSAEGSTQAVLDLNHEIDFIDLLIKDIKHTREKTDVYLRDIRYHSMVLLKVVCNSLNAGYAGASESMKQEIAALFERIIDSGVIQSIYEVIQKSAEKKEKKKQDKQSQTQDLKEFCFNRYTRFGCISSLNTVFQTSGKCNDTTVRTKLVSLITSEQQIGELFQFLNYVESKKVQKTMSPKSIMIIIVIFAVFLISLPVIFNFIRK